MRRLLAFLLVSIGLCGPALAIAYNIYNSPLGYVQQTSFASVTGLTTIPAKATIALLCNEGVALRWRDDGTNPTASVGMILGTGTATAPVCMTYSGNFGAIKFIQESATGGPLDVTYYQGIGQ